MPSMWTDESDQQPAGATSQGPTIPGSASLFGNSNAPSSSPPGSSQEPQHDSDIRVPPRVRQKLGGGLRTAGDAYHVCKALFEEQLKAAAAQRAPPNTPISGDASARSAFQLLLTDSQQRELFLHVARSQQSWPRLRSLVGSPPYHFLMPQDAAILNASGFARGRINMTYDAVGKVANMGQFGHGQLVDEHTREYRIAPRKLDPDDPLPGPEYFRSATKDLVLQVKVKRHNTADKRKLFHSEFKKQLFFPQPGETIVLQESSRLMSARGLRVPSQTHLRVKAVWLRSNGASTAAVLVGV